MTISVQIHPSAFGATGPLAGFATKESFPYANPLQFPDVPLPLGTEGITGAPGPGFIASASPLSFRTNIGEDGTFPVAPPDTEDTRFVTVVHVSPTSGSTVVQGKPPVFSKIEGNPAYGLDVTLAGVELEETVFESAINDPIGGQFKSNLMDFVTRGVILVQDDGVTMSATDIRDFTAP
jgi:hypothetical protein